MKAFLLKLPMYVLLVAFFISLVHKAFFGADDIIKVLAILTLTSLGFGTILLLFLMGINHD